MFNRKEVKSEGNKNFRKFYWPSVVSALVASLSLYGMSGGSSLSRSSSESLSEAGSDASADGFVLLAAFGIIAFILLAAILGEVIRILVLNNLTVGAVKYFLNIQQENADLGALIATFTSGKYGNVALTMFLRDLFTGLWSCLFIIPGIVKGYEYRMIPYILAEDPGMDRKEAFALSKKLMDGNKMAAFVYDLSFIGWSLLSVCTCGILNVFFVSPYKLSSDAVLYTTLKKNVCGTAAETVVDAGIVEEK